jgi:hypothetical protein
MPVATIMKEVSNRWANMSKSLKDPYITEAREDKRRYEKELGEARKKTTKVREPKRGKYFGENDGRYEDEIEIVDDDHGEENNKQEETDNKKISMNSWNSPTNNLHEVRSNKIILNTKLPEKFVEKKPLNMGSPYQFNLPIKKTPGNEFVRPSSNPFKYEPLGNPVSTFMNNEINSGSTEHNSNAGGISQSPFVFSPSPFTNNRSPGPSPNMMPNFDSFVSRNQMYKEPAYKNMNNNAPTAIRQGMSNYSMQPINATPTMNPFSNYNMMNASPAGFTPIRTSFQKQSPIFSPGNVDMATYFNQSPNINNFTNQSFGYRTTPINRAMGGTNPFDKGALGGMPNMQSNQKQGGNINDQGFDYGAFGG